MLHRCRCPEARQAADIVDDPGTVIATQKALQVVGLRLARAVGQQAVGRLVAQGRVEQADGQQRIERQGKSFLEAVVSGAHRHACQHRVEQHQVDRLELSVAGIEKGNSLAFGLIGAEADIVQTDDQL